MTIIRTGCLALAAVLLVCLMGACANSGADTPAPYDKDAVVQSISSQTVASNAGYELLWEDDAKCVMLKHKQTGRVWSNIPYEYYLSGGSSANVRSTLNLTVVDTQLLQWDTLNGFTEAFENGRIASEAIENGIKVTYFFDNYDIAVPVSYTLRGDSMEVAVDPQEIREGTRYLPVAIGLAPSLCSAANAESGSYLFIPTGSGALMYAQERAEGIRQYAGEVYGTDSSRLLTEVTMDEEPIRLPVFGVKDGGHALLGIIEDGAETAVIEAAAGNKRTGYSMVSALFYIRGYDVFPSRSQTLQWQDMKKMSAQRSSNRIAVGYYPLSGTEADYNGMAKTYRQYLLDRGYLKKTAAADGYYGVTLFGGVVTASTFLGIPVKSTKAMTDFSQAEQIARGLPSTPVIRLAGFGDRGVNPGQVAGGYDFPAVFGGNRGWKALKAYCESRNIPLFVDYDVVRYSETGSGFSYTFDAAKTATLRAAEQSPIRTPLRDYDKSMKYRLLKRGLLDEAVQRLTACVEKNGVTGVGLATLSSVAYSDYSDMKYIAKNGMAGDVVRLMGSIQQTSRMVAASEANAYAAAAADAVFDVPLSNGNYDAFDAAIPFYQMVFCGTKPLYSPAINLSGDADRQIVLAAAGGTRLGFALIYSFDTSYLETQSGKFYAAVFEDNRDRIAKAVQTYEDFYRRIAGAGIERYDMISAGISKTVFDNGVTLFANHTSKEADSPAGRLGAYELRWN